MGYTEYSIHMKRSVERVLGLVAAWTADFEDTLALGYTIQRLRILGSQDQNRLRDLRVDSVLWSAAVGVSGVNGVGGLRGYWGDCKERRVWGPVRCLAPLLRVRLRKV